MNTELKILAILAGTALLPALLLAALPAAGLGGPAALAAAFAAAGAAVLYGRKALRSGIISPLLRLAAEAQDFIAANYKLKSAVPAEGWPEIRGFNAALNRMMLELSAFRAFQLGQVVEDKSRAQTLMETIPDGVLLCDDHGRIMYANRKAGAALGIPRKDPAPAIPASVSVKPLAGPLAAIIGSAEDNVRADISVPSDEDGFLPEKTYRLISRCFPLFSSKLPGRIIIIRDVTLEKEIENSRETFFHMITHDMRAPLTSIIGYANLLERAVPKTPHTEKCLRAINSGGTRLNGMVQDILNTMKLERGELKPERKRLSAESLCAGVMGVFSLIASSKGVELKTEIPAGIFLDGDGPLLDRVLNNLVGNALKFTPAGGRVLIQVSRNDELVRFQVEDTGPGIPADKLTEIFEKHAQLDEHRHMGFGLGLAMCKLAVEAHGGRIWAESEEGGGSRFIFTVPDGPRETASQPGEGPGRAGGLC